VSYNHGRELTFPEQILSIFSGRSAFSYDQAGQKNRQDTGGEDTVKGSCTADGSDWRA
jgi:hypothetical protein